MQQRKDNEESVSNMHVTTTKATFSEDTLHTECFDTRKHERAMKNTNTWKKDALRECNIIVQKGAIMTFSSL